MNELSHIRPTIADNVRRLRKLQGYTQEQLSEACGADRSSIGRIEQETQNPSIGILEKVASALDVDPLILLLPETRETDPDGPIYDYSILEWNGTTAELKDLSASNRHVVRAIIATLVEMASKDDSIAESLIVAAEALQEMKNGTPEQPETATVETPPVKASPIKIDLSGTGRFDRCATSPASVQSDTRQSEQPTLAGNPAS